MKNPPLNETPEQRRQRLEREANALFLDIDASFGKTAAKKAPKPKSEPKEPALTTFLKEANAMAKAMESPTWKPVAIVHYIIKQKCECCGATPECVGGTLVRHAHSRRTDTWDFPRPDMREFAHLPQIIIEEVTPVPLCPQCIHEGMFDRVLRDELDERDRREKAELAAEMLTSDDLPEINPIALYLTDTDDSGEEIIMEDKE